MQSIDRSPKPITFHGDQLRDYDFSSHREWLITNGVGGFASSTLSGSNTRRYHALLVASMKPPLERVTFLSKLEETVRAESSAYELSSNQYPGVIHPQGHLLLDHFNDTPTPQFTYRLGSDILLQKTIWMEYGGNTVYVRYKLLQSGSSIQLKLAPLICRKSYHQEMRREAAPSFHLYPIDSGLSVQFDGTQDRLHLSAREMRCEPADYWHMNIEHMRERERGMDWLEDLYCPAHFVCDMDEHEEITFIASMDDEWSDPMESYRRVLTRQKKLLDRSPVNDPFLSKLVLASDCFLMDRKTHVKSSLRLERSTILAGYHWFSDWSRDTMISIPGICICTGKESVARDIILSYANYIDQGMLPNRFPDSGTVAEYNNVDGTLWYFQAIWAYLHGYDALCPNYYEIITRPPAHLSGEKLWTLHAIIPKLTDIIDWHVRGARYGIHMDPSDHLLWAGYPGTQLTWMDAKIGDRAFTSRVGKPVEVNALWCNALHILAELLKICGMDGKAYEEMARQAMQSFSRSFVRPDHLGLYDVIGNDFTDASIRPNQIFAISLPFSPLEKYTWTDILIMVQDHLLTPVGLRTLSPQDPEYRGYYAGNAWERDGAYHQGTVWPWLLGHYVLAHYRVHSDISVAESLLAGLERHLEEAGVGSISEIFDGDSPHAPQGAIAQAWSVAEILRAKTILGR
jgi:predicted glycogen debranching enzyme